MQEDGIQYRDGMLGAAKGGHLELFKYFYGKHRKNEAHTIVRRAARKGHMNIVEWVIGLKLIYDWQCVPHLAASGNWDFVRRHYRNGASCTDDALVASANGGHLDMVKFFMEKGAKSKDEAFIRACIKDHREIVEYLLDQGANSWEGLDVAAANGHARLSEILIQKAGDRINVKDLQNAIQGAVSNRYTTVVRVLDAKIAALSTTEQESE